MDYVDVVFANRPDPNTPMEGETLVMNRRTDISYLSMMTSTVTL